MQPLRITPKRAEGQVCTNRPVSIRMKNGSDRQVSQQIQQNALKAAATAGHAGSVLWFMSESRETARMLQTSEHPTMPNVFAWRRSFRKCLQLVSENQEKPASSAQGHPASGFFDSQHSAISRRSTKTQVSKSRDIHLLPRREAAPEAK